MSEKTPVRVNFDGSGNPTGFAELQSSEYIGLDDGGTGGSYASLSALLEGLGLGTSDAPTFAALQTSGNVVIGGNLQVDGTTTTVNSTTVTIDDPIFTLGGDTAPASDDSKDRGIEFRWHNGTTAKLGFFGFDDSTGKFTFIPDATNAAEVFSGTAGTIVANLEGNVTGTVSSLSGLTTDDLSEGSTNLYVTDERIDDRVNALIIGGAGVDTSYDDAAGTLTLTADLSEITTDLNERIDDQVAALLIDSNTSGIDISYDDANGQLTISSDLSEVVEALQDNVQGLFVGGTGVTSAYDDASNALTLSIDFSEFDSDNIVEGSTNLFVTNERIDDRVNALLTDATTSGIDISYDDAGNALTLSVDLSEIVESLQDNVQGLFSGGTGITTSYDDAANTLSLSIDFSEFDTDDLTEGSTNLFHTTERVQDVVGGQIVTNGSHTGISFAYDDANDGAIDATVSLASFDTDNLSEGSSNLYFTDERAQDAVGGMLTGNTETLITVTYDDANALINFVVDNDLSNYDNSTSGFITATLTQEEVEDFVGGMVSGNTETLIGVTYDDTNGKLDFVVDNDLANYSNTNSAFITLTSLSGSTGVTYDNSTGAISIGQAVGTTDNVTFNDVTVSGTLNSDDVTATTMTVSNDLVVTGDLTVQGTTTTLNTDTVSTEENMIKLASGNIGNSTDIGIYGKVVQSSTTKYVGLHWDPGAGQNKFKLFDSLTVEPTGTVDTADASYTKATLVADIEGDVTGALTGNADTATALASAQNFSLSGDVTASAVSFDGTGAVALSTTVTQSAVTQHEAALTITESQISDLQSYLTSETSHADVVVDGDFTSQGIMLRGASAGTYSILTDNSSNWNTAYSWGDHSTAGYLTSFTETNDLSSAVTWANVPNANITESSVTQHEAALSITESQISDLGSYITATSSDTLTNKTINFEDNTAIIEFAVTVSNPGSGNKYYLDGELSANIQLIPGVTYRFDQSNSSNSGHPLVLSTTSESAGVTSYTTGVTTNGTPGSSGAYTQIVVDGATADKLYYYCSNHSGMGGGIVSIQGSSFVAGTGISISGETISTTITQYADSDVESYLSGGTGVTFSSGVISIGQAVGTSDNVTFNDVTISGNLDVNGTTTTIDTTNTTVTDSIIELANGTTGTPANDAGLVIERGTADNAFIGFDESADKFIVGTGTFTGASTGNLTISTGTLVANLEGTVPQSSVTAHQAALSITESQISDLQSYLTTESNDLTSAVTWANVPDANITATSVRQHITGGDGITFSSGQIDVDSTIITGQSALAGSVDTANDLILLYDNSSTSLTKVDVATLLASAGTGSFNDFNLAADTGTAEVVADGNTVTIAGGTGIDTVVSTTDTVTVAIDNTVITTSSSIGDLSDVDITTSAPTNGQALVWNATNSEFEPGTVASSTNYFQTIAVSGQSDIVPDSTTDTLNFAAGANITLTTDASTDTVTIAATGGAANAFSTLAVAGQSNVVADAETDTLTLTAGTGMTITTDASTDTITFASSGGGGGSLPVILSGSTSDPITLSDITVAGAIPFTAYDGSTDNIQLGSTQTAVTTFADNDADTSIELERTSDDDTVYIKAGGTDVVTATSSGVTITNLTVTGTTTQANELKVTDTLFELNADGGSLTTDAGMIIERGSTGDNAAFIWDESADAFVVGTTATDGSSATNLTVTEATLKAATQSQSDNSTNVATTAYVDTALGSLSSNSITDADNDTKIQVEEGSDEDIIRADTGGQERLTIDNNVSMAARGGFFTHNLAMHASETFTIASTEGTVAAGPLDIQGTVDVQGSLVVL